MKRCAGPNGAPDIATNRDRDHVLTGKQATRPDDHAKSPTLGATEKHFVSFGQRNRELRRVHALPPQPGKNTDSRAATFVKRHGRLVQVELDALRPDVLRGLFTVAIEEFWDPSAHQAALAHERKDRRTLAGRR